MKLALCICFFSFLSLSHLCSLLEANLEILGKSWRPSGPICYAGGGRFFPFLKDLGVDFGRFGGGFSKFLTTSESDALSHFWRGILIN